ncbi:carboxypeptidase-like regulatory domain-containing protein [Chryseobacterium sp. SIMBA_029]|uniref:carboxypeptidase-like regulatory domain-containing protein n=1 Tax=Chryseobacterium sp. SIMBA_029 TaxID=3085772 RepID=UPI00397BFF1F
MIKQLYTKYCAFCFVLLSGIFFSQTLKKIKITDLQGGKPIANARVILSNEVVYTNDDGIVLVPENAGPIEISKSGYKTETLKSITSTISLSPLYKNIDEVKITVVDIREIFTDVLRHYSKRYYSKPSLYDIIYKEKSIYDGTLQLLLIADAKFWSVSNAYNYKNSINHDNDAFFQVDLNNIKYYKAAKSQDSVFLQKQERSTDHAGFMFMNYTLRRLVQHIDLKGTKYSGKIVDDTGGEQTMVFNITTKSLVKISGKLLYNTNDKVISHLEIVYDQSGFKPYEGKLRNGEMAEFQPGNGTMSLDFYKKDKKYIPSRASVKSDSFVTHKGIAHTGIYERDIIFQTFHEAQEDGLKNRIDFNKNMWENIPNHEQKETKILLSKEEQEFINEN